MKVNRKAVIVSPDGQAFNELLQPWVAPVAIDGKMPPESTQTRKLTLGVMCYSALNSNALAEKEWEIAAERYDLMGKFVGKTEPDEIELSAKQVTMLHELLPSLNQRGVGIWVIGQVGSLLEKGTDHCEIASSAVYREAEEEQAA